MKRWMFFILGMILFSSFVVSSEYFGVGRFNGIWDYKVHLYNDDGSFHEGLGDVGIPWGGQDALYVDFGDSDGDGYDDVVGITNENKKWYIYDLSGNVVHQFGDPGFEDSTISLKVVFGDVNGDGDDEFALTSNRGIAIYDFGGSQLYQATQMGTPITDFDFGDVDGDGKAELGVTAGAMAFGTSSRWRIYDLESGSASLLLYGGHNWPYDHAADPANVADYGNVGAREIAFGDFDGDLKDEFVVVTYTMYVEGKLQSCYFYNYTVGQEQGVLESLDIPYVCAKEGLSSGGDETKQEAEYIAFGDFDDDGYDDFGVVSHKSYLPGESWVLDSSFLNIYSLRDCGGEGCEELLEIYGGHLNSPIFNDIDFGVLDGTRVVGVSTEDVFDSYAWKIFDGAGNTRLECEDEWDNNYNAWSFAFAKAPGDEIPPEEEGTDCLINFEGACCYSPDACSNIISEGTGCDGGVCCASAGECTGEIPSECELTDAYWSAESPVDEGDTVNLVVEGNEACNGLLVEFLIKEDDNLGTGDWDDPGADSFELHEAPSDVVFGARQAISTWDAEWHLDDDGMVGDDPEYIFRARLKSDITIYFDSNNELDVTGDGYHRICDESFMCIDADDDGEDLCDEAVDCSPGGAYCGDSQVNQEWEQCDDSDFRDGIDDCNEVNSDWTGDLDCYSVSDGDDIKCTFDLDGCTLIDDGSPVDDDVTVEVIYGSCECLVGECLDGVGSRERTIITYEDGTETNRETLTQDCFLGSTEDVPFMNLISIFLTLLLLSIFYYRKE
jgi:hypothetical protein